MGTVINKGTEFLRNGELFRITKKLNPNRFEARHHRNESNVITLTSLDVSKGVSRGDIEFVTRGLSGKVIPFHDLAGMPEKDLKEVMRRKKYVETAIDYTRYDQSKACMENAVKDVAEELSEIVINNNENKRNRKKAPKNQRKAPSVRTVYRWMSTFVKSGQNIRSLVSIRKHHNRKSSLHPKVVEIINFLIGDHYMRSHRITVAALYDEILIAINDYNKSIPASKKNNLLKAPHINTIYRYIKKLDGYEMAKCRYGKSYADYKYRVIAVCQDRCRIV